jgi:hypothetical protein
MTQMHEELVVFLELELFYRLVFVGLGYTHRVDLRFFYEDITRGDVQPIGSIGS